MNYKDESHLIGTYKKFQIVLKRGDGVYLFDENDKKYLDFSSGIGVCGLGYNNIYFNNALKSQIDKLIHTSNLYYHENIAMAATNLAKASGLKSVFFTNSGTEAIEGAMKAARRYAYNKGIKGGEFIAFENSFHGRTLGALSLTATKAYKKPFKPLIKGVKFAKFNDIKSVKKLLSKKTCAIILESVQGEGGIRVAQKEFYQDLRKLCDKKDLVLIADEIQCGMGRSGKFFAFEYADIRPDILASAKALGCGLSVGAFVLNERLSKDSLMLGDHGSTYGGNPLACAAINAVFDIFSSENILKNVQVLTPILENKLDSLKAKFSFIKSRQGLGFMQGLSFDNRVNVSDILSKCQEKGLLLLKCGQNDLRFLPPLISKEEHINKMSEILEAVLREVE